jgi:hypothetical protein
MFVTPHTPISRDADMPLRPERTSMMRARKRMRFSPRQQVVFSKACARTWMGEYVFDACILLLTLAKVWRRPCVHCQSSQNYNGVVTHLD